MVILTGEMEEEKLITEPVVVSGIGEKIVGQRDCMNREPIVGSTSLGSITFKHIVCNCRVHLRQVSETHNVLLCTCGLRIPVPIEVVTWGDFKKEFSRFAKGKKGT